MPGAALIIEALPDAVRTVTLALRSRPRERIRITKFCEVQLGGQSSRNQWSQFFLERGTLGAVRLCSVGNQFRCNCAGGQHWYLGVSSAGVIGDASPALGEWIVDLVRPGGGVVVTVHDSDAHHVPAPRTGRRRVSVRRDGREPASLCDPQRCWCHQCRPQRTEPHMHTSVQVSPSMQKPRRVLDNR